jgi:hypothetical protein
MAYARPIRFGSFRCECYWDNAAALSYQQCFHVGRLIAIVHIILSLLCREQTGSIHGVKCFKGAIIGPNSRLPVEIDMRLKLSNGD